MNKIQTIGEYQQLAARTCAPLPTLQEDLLHMNLGIMTEIGEALDPIKKNLAYKKEIDVHNVGEELADAAWYIANRARLAKDSRIDHAWSEMEGFNSTYELVSKDLMSILMNQGHSAVFRTLRCIIPESQSDEYHLFPDFVAEEALGIMEMVTLKVVAEYYGLDFWQILTNNISKLQVRYPEKFTEEAALNRNLDAERVELEKTDYSERDFNKDE